MLSEPARQALDGESSASVSDASLWELAIKASRGRILLPASLGAFFAVESVISGYDSVPIKRSHILRTTELPLLHRDPFDRLLIAQALDEGLVFVTRDEEVSNYPELQTLW